MQNPLPDLLKSLYVAACCGGLIAVLTVFIALSRRSSVSRTWEPLFPVVHGTLERKYVTAILQGAFRDHPVRATLVTGGAENPDTFQVVMTGIPGGGNWSVQYGSEKLFGKDQWYLKASDEGLQQRLTEAGVLAEMQGWKSHPTISYQGSTGTLQYEEEGNVPNPERFRAQLDLLLRMIRINQQANTAGSSNEP